MIQGGGSEEGRVKNEVGRERQNMRKGKLWKKIGTEKGKRMLKQGLRKGKKGTEKRIKKW